MIKNIIFDVGYVLVDFRPKGVLTEDLGIEEADAEAILEQTIYSPLWTEMDRGAIPEEELIAQMRANIPERLLADFERFFGEARPGYVRTYPTSEQWLKSFKERGFHVYILSNYPVSFYEEHKKKFDFLKHADGQVVSGYLGMLKPDAEIYQHLLKKYDLKAEECIFIDDREENIDGANRQGIHGVHFTSMEAANREIERIIREEAVFTECV